MFVLGTKLPTWKNYRKKALMNLHVLPFFFMMVLILCCHIFCTHRSKEKVCVPSCYGPDRTPLKVVDLWIEGSS